METFARVRSLREALCLPRACTCLDVYEYKPRASFLKLFLSVVHSDVSLYNGASVAGSKSPVMINT